MFPDLLRENFRLHFVDISKGQNFLFGKFYKKKSGKNNKFLV